MRHIAILSGLLLVFVLPLSALGYGVETHAGLTKEIARFYSQHFPRRAFTDAETRLLMKGAVDEDDGVRMANHFYDPINFTGLTFRGQHYPSRSWAQDKYAQLAYTPLHTLQKMSGYALIAKPSTLESSDYTWQRAIEDYASGDTERGLKGLGHILHLIEDLTVPAHVRNDPHPPAGVSGDTEGDEDPYEEWTHKFTPYNINVASRITESKPVVGLLNLGAYFDELALYTNTNFFSEDRISDGYFLSPQPSRLEVVRSDRDYEYLGIKDIGGGYPIARRRVSLITNVDNKLSTDSDVVSQSSWDRLSVKAVQYGAGVVDLFFKEVEKLKSDPNFKPREDTSALGQLIDIVGDNVAALLSGPPSPTSVVSNVSPLNTIAPAEESDGEVELQVLSGVSLDTQEAATFAVPSPVVQPALAPTPIPTPTPAPVPYVAYSDGTNRQFVGGAGGPAPFGGSSPAPELVSEPTPEPADIIAPGAINDLVVSSITEYGFVLSWTASGDDEGVGQASAYELRFSEELITADNFADATLVASPVPHVFGSQEAVPLSGLQPMTTYYAALIVRDEAENASLLSNIVSAQTKIAAPLYPVISEVFVDMVGADTGEFIELYNPTDAAIDLSDYSLQFLTGSAESFESIQKKNFITGAVIPAKGFYLIGTGGYAGSVAADMTWSVSLTNSAGRVFLVNNQLAIESAVAETIIDVVSYGVDVVALEGQSLERRVLASGVCESPEINGEFLGNGCDTGASSDFLIRSSPRPQNRSNLPEPRVAPTTPSGEPVILTYNPSGRHLAFRWLASVDANGESQAMRYKLTNTTNPTVPVALYEGANLLFDAYSEEVGYTYRATLQAFDRDGLGSEVVPLSVDIASYLSSLTFYRDPLSPQESPSYRIKLNWGTYPFIPVNFSSGPRWHVAAFYYNQEAPKITYLGSLNSGHNWGIGVSMPSSVRIRYPNCYGGSFVTTGASLILPDDATRCSGVLGGVKSSAIDFGLLRDGVFDTQLLPETFSSPPVVGESYITVAYYSFVDGNPLGLDQGLVAIDKQKFILQAAP